MPRTRPHLSETEAADRLKAILSGRANGLTDRAIADDLGLHSSTLFSWLRRYHPDLAKWKVSRDRAKTIFELNRVAGLSFAQIANQLDMTREAVSGLVYRHKKRLMEEASKRVDKATCDIAGCTRSASHVLNDGRVCCEHHWFILRPAVSEAA